MCHQYLVEGKAHPSLYGVKRDKEYGGTYLKMKAGGGCHTPRCVSEPSVSELGQTTLSSYSPLKKKGRGNREGRNDPNIL